MSEQTAGARSLEGKKAVVIGGAGLIGSHVVERLLDEPVGEILVYDNFARGRRDNLAEALRDERVAVYDVGGELGQADILRAALDGADTVFHLAALWLLQCHEFPRAAFDVNVRGTFNVLEACVDAGVERLVYSSSASVYGDARETPMTEEHPFDNKNFYGATKIASEAMIDAYRHRYGLSYAALRYMNVYGSRQDYKGTYIAVIMKMLDRLDQGLAPVIFGDGSESYDFVYVSDVAEANVRAALSSADGAYNVGRGIGTSLRELAELLLELTDFDGELEFAERPNVGQVTNRIGSIEKAEAELGYRWSVDLREGLERLIEWRRGHIEELEARRAAA